MHLALLALASILPAVSNFTASVDLRLAESDPIKGLCRFLSYPGSARAGVFKPNPDFWLRGVDLSCASPWNDSSGHVRAGTAISRRHIIYAEHYPLPHGARMIFVGVDGEVCPCRLVDSRRVATTDLRVGLLDYELTPNIRPAKILPDDFGKCLGSGEGLPVVTFNQREEAVVADWVGQGTNVLRQTSSRCRMSSDSRRMAFWKPIIVGDSGDPAFLIFGREPVLLHTLTGGGSGSGPFVTHWRRHIQSVMDALCPGYRLEVVALEKNTTDAL